MDKFFFYFSTISFVCMGILHAAVKDNPENFAGGTLKYELLELEKIRKNNNQQFTDQLASLRSKVNIMTNDERCLYQYLVVYKKSYKGDYPDSIKNLKQTEHLCESPEYKARVLQFLANLQVITGDFEPALENLNAAIQITASSQDYYLRSLTNNVAAITYRLMNQDETALKYSELLLNNNLSDEDKCTGNFNKHRILMRQGLGGEYGSEISAAIDQCQSVGNHIAALFLQFDQIRYLFPIKESSDPVEARKAVKTLESLADDVNNTQFKNIRVYYHALMAHIYWIVNMNDQAEFYGLLAIKENSSIGESEQLLLALNALIQLSVEANKMQSAYVYSQQKNEMEKAIYERKLASEVAYYRVKHANLAQELEIKQLNQNNQLLSLENKLTAETFKKQQLIMLLVFSLLILLALWTYRIKKKRDYFKQVAEIDHLTQVFTRKAFEERMKEMLNACSLENETVNVIIMDLDHFKLVNDVHGHLVGDWVLKHVILTCEEVINQDIMMARLGGEEFCMVSPGISGQQMAQLAETMRKAIAQMDCNESGANIHITASFGVSSTKVSGYSYSELLTHADLALFAAKNKGRNRVVEYTSIMETQAVN